MNKCWHTRQLYVSSQIFHCSVDCEMARDFQVFRRVKIHSKFSCWKMRVSTPCFKNKAKMKKLASHISINRSLHRNCMLHLSFDEDQSELELCQHKLRQRDFLNWFSRSLFFNLLKFIEFQNSVSVPSNIDIYQTLNSSDISLSESDWILHLLRYFASTTRNLNEQTNGI